MRSIFIVMAAAASLMSTGGVLAVDMPPLAKKHNCGACHAIEKKLVGPGWRDVSKAYNANGTTGIGVSPAYKIGNKVSDILAKNNAKSAEEWLLHKVSRGGSGNWGTMPMPANDPGGSKEGDFKELIKFILSLEKK